MFLITLLCGCNHLTAQPGLEGPGWPPWHAWQWCCLLAGCLDCLPHGLSSSSRLDRASSQLTGLRFQGLKWKLQGLGRLRGHRMPLPLYSVGQSESQGQPWPKGWGNRLHLLIGMSRSHCGGVKTQRGMTDWRPFLVVCHTLLREFLLFVEL